MASKELKYIEKELEKTKRNYEEWKGYVANDKDLEVEAKYQEELSQMIANARWSYEEKIATLESIKKRLQAFEIIKNKNVDIYLINVCINVEHYNSVIKSKNFNNNYSYEIWYELTQEEWDLLKEVLKNED